MWDKIRISTKQAIYPYICLAMFFIMPFNNGYDESVRLSVNQEIAVVGEMLIWELVIPISDGQSVDLLSVETNDPKIWLVKVDLQMPNAMTATQIVPVKVVSKTPGVFIPILIVHYKIKSVENTILVRSDKSIQVFPVLERVKITLQSLDNLIDKFDHARQLLTVENNSPFAMMIELDDPNLIVSGFPPMLYLPPFQSAAKTLTITLKGESPVPYLALNIKWLDDLQNENIDAVHIIGAPHSTSMYQEPLFLKILQETNVWFGALFGALIGFGITLINEWRTRRRQEDLDNSRLYGLLQWDITQIRLGLGQEKAIEFVGLLEIFKSQELFILLHKNNLYEAAMGVYLVGQKYNDSMHDRHGVQRSMELLEKCKELEEAIRKQS